MVAKKFGAGAAPIDTFGAESSDIEMHACLCAVRSAMVDEELHQRLHLIIRAYDVLVAHYGVAGEPGPARVLAGRADPVGGRAFAFGPFRLFPSRRLLLEGNEQVQIGSRAFDILTVLVERAGEVVRKDELVARVWPNVFVDDSNLKTQVSALRRSLGEGRAGRHYIVAVPGRGYNFVAPVRSAAGPVPAPPGPEPGCGGDRPDRVARRHDAGAAPFLPGLARARGQRPWIEPGEAA